MRRRSGTKNFLRTDREMEKRLLEYIEATSSQSNGWWNEKRKGTGEDRRGSLNRYRLRYEARRSVAQLFTDAKTEPFLRASNVGIGIEAIMGEWLIANTLGNTVDRDPPLDVFDPRTNTTDNMVRDFYRDYYLRTLGARDVYQDVLREVFSVGGAITKMESSYPSRTVEHELWVLMDPETHAPLMQPDANGEPQPIPADPETSQDELPFSPQSGKRVQVGLLTGVETVRAGWEPKLRVRTVDQIMAPMNTTFSDPNDWDFLHDEYTVSAWWFLERQGEMERGGIPRDRLQQLWKLLNVNPSEAWRKPDGALVQPIRMRESHLKFPATKTGEPVELVVRSLPEYKFILSYRISPFPRRPYFNHKVWSRTNHWMGKGIPETVFSIRNSLDMILNQDLDAGNLYNQPPLLISSLAGVNDENFEQSGPGAVWYLRDINGMKFLPPPIRSRDPIAMLNWLTSMAQRSWGVTDLNLNAPTSSLSPNISTATGVVQTLQQGNIKFAHFVREVESVRSKELGLFHSEMGTRWTGSETYMNGEGVEEVIDRKRLLPHLQVRAVSDGNLTNPLLRQQRLEAVLVNDVNNPIMQQQPEAMYELTKQYHDAAGVEINLRKPQEIQEMQIAKLLTQTQTLTPLIPQAMEELKAAMAQQAQQQGGKGQASQPGPVKHDNKQVI